MTHCVSRMPYPEAGGKVGQVGNVVEFLSTSRAARRLGVSEARVRQMAREGKLPSVETQLGRLFDAVDLDRIEAERRRERPGQLERSARRAG